MTESELRAEINKWLEEYPIQSQLQFQELKRFLDTGLMPKAIGLYLRSGVWIQRQDDGIYEARLSYSMYGTGAEVNPWNDEGDNYFHGRANNVAQAVVVLIRELRSFGEQL